MLIVLGPAPASSAAAGSWAAVVAPENGTGAVPSPAGQDPATRPATGAAAAGPVVVFRREQAPEVVRGLPARLGAAPAEVRWVLAGTAREYPRWLEAGVSVDRCWDLGLVQRLLVRAAAAPGSGVGPAGAGYTPAVEVPVADPLEPGRPAAAPAQQAMFDLAAAPGAPGADADVTALAAELTAQRAAIAASARPARLRLLAAAESQGALVAAEMRAAGLPWRRDVHEALLADRLGPRPAEGDRPARLQEAADRIAEALGAPDVNPDSPPALLRALHAAGVGVDSTRQGDLARWIEQGGADRERRAALLAPVLDYKARARLWTAHGWHWLDEWVTDGRFRPTYLVGAVVSGRWAAHGGGAMQVPVAVRDAVRADPGGLLTVADASQVEPRILAAMSGDAALARAGSTPDLYREVAEQGRSSGTALADRGRAKLALLGAMYGATSGDAAALLPQLRRLYPQAVGLLEQAAAVGEGGGQVSTWLGRWSPAPDEEWRRAVADRSTAAAEASAARRRRAAGRFTRNFVVQGTAAEWALCWMGEVRRRLRQAGAATRLVFFVHDEIVLHGPAGEAGDVRALVAEAAAEAGRLLFGSAPVDFPLTAASVASYAAAK